MTARNEDLAAALAHTSGQGWSAEQVLEVEEIRNCQEKRSGEGPNS